MKPSSPEESKRTKQKEEKKFELEKEIKRHTSNLFEMAKALSKKNDNNDSVEEISDVKSNEELEDVTETT